jgi:hypothetical protein
MITLGSKENNNYLFSVRKSHLVLTSITTSLQITITQTLFYTVPQLFLLTQNLVVKKRVPTFTKESGKNTYFEKQLWFLYIIYFMEG